MLAQFDQKRKGSKRRRSLSDSSLFTQKTQNTKKKGEEPTKKKQKVSHTGKMLELFNGNNAGPAVGEAAPAAEQEESGASAELKAVGPKKSPTKSHKKSRKRPTALIRIPSDMARSRAAQVQEPQRQEIQEDFSPQSSPPPSSPVETPKGYVDRGHSLGDGLVAYSGSPFARPSTPRPPSAAAPGVPAVSGASSSGAPTPKLGASIVPGAKSPPDLLRAKTILLSDPHASAASLDSLPRTKPSQVKFPKPQSKRSLGDRTFSSPIPLFRPESSSQGSSPSGVPNFAGHEADDPALATNPQRAPSRS